MLQDTDQRYRYSSHWRDTGMRQRLWRHQTELLAVADTAIVFAPRHFRRVGAQLVASDVMVDADFRAADTQEE